MNYLPFFRANTKILTFVVLFTFFSGFGQTFLLSIYIPHFLQDFQISRTFYSSLYSLATVLSGITIIFAGKIIDRVPVKPFAVVVVCGLVLANLTAGFSSNAITLFVAIFLLRFFGQGLSTHTAFTVAGKYFDKARGKALGIAYLGFPFAEGLMPAVILFGIGILGWRNNFLLSAAVIAGVLLPLTFFLLHKFTPQSIIEKGFEAKPQQKTKPTAGIEANITQMMLLRSIQFYLIAPMPFLIGFVITAVFFHQTFIADFKGWTVEWMAITIAVYAVSSFVFSILSGPLIDRFSAKTLFPFLALPLVIGFAFLMFSSHPFVAIPYWLFIGISAGLSSTVSTAYYAENYGVGSLGAVRSLFTFVMIIGTALGPVFYSLLLDAGLNFSNINSIISAVVIMHFLLLVLIRRDIMNSIGTL